MKPCVLVTLDYPPERGGVARYLGNLVRASSGGIAAVFVPTDHDASGPGHVQPVPFFWPYWPRWAPLIAFFRKQHDRLQAPVFLISHVLPVGTAAWIASFFRPISYAVLLHGLDLRLAQQSRWKRWLVGRILANAKQVITNSTFVSAEVTRLFPKRSVFVLSPGVEEVSFPDRISAREKYHVTDETFQLLAVTRLVPRKGLDQILAALALLPAHVHLTIIGAGHDEARLRSLALPLGDRVRFETAVSDADRNAWYAAADAFVLPTRDEGHDVEGFGIVFLEAALAGLPVIAGRSGGVIEAVVDGETGMLVDPLDSQAIATAIKALMDNPLLRERYGRQGQARARTDFRWSDRWTQFSQTLSL